VPAARPAPARSAPLAAALLLAAGAAGCGRGEATSLPAAATGAGAARPGAAAVRPPAPAAAVDTARLAGAYARAAALPKLRSLVVVWRDSVVAERYYRGARADRPANLKSASKSVVSALVGVALAEGRLRGTDQPLAELLAPGDVRPLDATRRAITLGDLLSMRSGLGSTSIGNYGAWVSSRDWVRYALARPVVAPAGHAGGPMIYSTGNTHLLSAALTRAAGQSLYAFYARALARPLGIVPRPWPTDPRGIYFGGNEMRMTPREMARFGQLFLHRGAAPPGAPAAGRAVLPAAWVDSSWAPRAVSDFSGFEYGYGWWMRTARGAAGPHRVYFAWGYGGQFVFVVPDLALVAAVTSDPDAPERDHGHLSAIHALLDEAVLPAVGG
jgi:CubicO group peptidase (beta-lactamase class C family)